ncbi:ATP-binding domain-containing protein [Siphonobacter sp. SORGH_AS_0500]|uniref:DEAD/DEAH box helicase n=1 Tax=Siphonobacter sp. SORGH_AS_0500 TaxID=1864824 RepID=UPI00286B785E|nr:ATP-binding domain-containing protein [Siphonobacter sp. SORGH_AS_0500]
MEKNVNEVLIKEEPSIQHLIDTLDSFQDINSNIYLYHHFPHFPNETGESSVNPDILLIGENIGVIILKCVDFSERFTHEKAINIDKKLNQIDRLLYAKIIKDTPELIGRRRELKIEITPAIYLNNCDEIPNYPEWNDYELVNSDALLKELILKNHQTGEISVEEFKALKSTIEGSKGIFKSNDRNLRDRTNISSSKGSILSAIESAIHNFDLEQKRAALFTLNGPQRIRGLAGSGKTIILAMKVALIHIQNPEAEILYTYYTKALYDLVKKLITRFYRQFVEKDPDWNKIHVMHAWGGFGLEGVYYNACNNNNIPPLKYNEAKNKMPDDPFGFVCKELNLRNLKKQYDYAILDEAQDFPKEFYQVCRQITKHNRVVWAYDDFQNILNVKIQDERETFGRDLEGNYHIDFSRIESTDVQDLVLHKCYRNPRKILISAFALGLGIYNYDFNNPKSKPKIIQRLENNEHWESLGFTVEQGNSSVSDLMIINRPEDNSPAIKNTYLSDDDVIKVKTFTNFEDECKEVVSLIEKDISDELNPEDISIICLDTKNVWTYFNEIKLLLNRKGIKTFSLLEAPTDNTNFKVPKHVTLSTIFRAKGNEAGSVYVIGIDAVFFDKDNITERNKLFTAITRSIAWVTLTGVSPLADICKNELDILKKNDYKLTFIQPSEQDVVTIKQTIDEKQLALNKIERIAEDAAKNLNIDKDEFIKDIKAKLSSKK